MPLNNSGPISLGGSTVGQSINLELGNAATALASINSTQFRTLAGIASGTIALSNFYGKSNAVSYITYFIGNNVSGEAAQNGPAVMSNTGYVAIPLNTVGGGYFTLGVVNPDGTKSSSGPWGYTPNPGAIGSLQKFTTDWSTLPSIILKGAGKLNFVNLNAPTTFIFPSALNSTSVASQYFDANVSRDASGNVYILTIEQPNPKYEANFVLRKYNSSGTGQWYVAGGSNIPPNNRINLLVQTNGAPIWIYNTRYFRVFSNNGTSPYANPIASGLSEEACPGAIIDANNVIWLYSDAGPTLRQVNAARTSITGYNFSVGSDGYSIIGMGYYNGYVYILSLASNPYNQAGFYISAFSSTDGSEYWTRKITFTGVNVNNVSGVGYFSNANNLQVTSQGVCIYFNLSNPSTQSGGTNPRYYLRFPLNGALTTTTYNNIAANAGYPDYVVNMTVTTVARTWTNTGTYTLSSSNTTVVAGTGGSTTTNMTTADYTGSGYFARFKQNLIS